VSAIKDDSTIGKTYDLCGPEAFTWNELYDRLLSLYGLRKPKIHLPLPVARSLAVAFEAFLPNPPFNREQLLMTEEDNVGDPGPAERDFGMEQEPFEQGIARYLKS
jgi:NADH dehydrogenase